MGFVRGAKTNFGRSRSSATKRKIHKQNKCEEESHEKQTKKMD